MRPPNINQGEGSAAPPGTVRPSISVCVLSFAGVGKCKRATAITLTDTPQQCLPDWPAESQAQSNWTHWGFRSRFGNGEPRAASFSFLGTEALLHSCTA